MAEIDIGKFAKQVEAGHGCALQAQLWKIPFDDSLSVMKQIANQIQTDRKTNQAISDIRYYSELAPHKETGPGNEPQVEAGLAVPANRWHDTQGPNPVSVHDTHGTPIVSEGVAVDDTTHQKAGDRFGVCEQ